MKPSRKNINYASALSYTLLLLAVLSFTACSVDENQNLEERNFQLVWSDDFDGAAGTAVDATKWVHDVGTGDNGWGNQELQYYTEGNSNAALDGNGNLLITAKRESFGGQPFTSARINTKDLFEQAFGRFEVRMKTPYGPGIWPAFWLLGADIDDNPWPQAGEIDVMELRGQLPNIIAGSLHGPGYSAGDAVTTEFELENGRFDAEYHVFAIEWGEDYIDYFVDDFAYQRITPDDVDGEWVFDKPFYLILNVAVGGTFVGFPTSQTPFPQALEIDYVRAYQQQN